jgi:hypothetical protein
VLKHSFKGNWKMALENSVDGYDPNILHHAAMMLITKGRKSIWNRPLASILTRSRVI